MFSSLEFTLNTLMKYIYHTKKEAVLSAVWELEKVFQVHLWMSNFKNRLWGILYFGVLLFLFSMFLQVTEEWICWCTKLLCCGDDHPHVSFWIIQDRIELSFFWNYTITIFVLKGTWVPQGEKYFRPGPWTGFDGVLHMFSLAAIKKLPLFPTFKF